MTKQELDKYMDEITDGSMPALSVIYNEFSGAVYGIAVSILRDREGAQDIMQDTFIKVMSSAREYRSDLNGKAWLFSIARNLAISKYRRDNCLCTTDISESACNICSEKNPVDESVVNSLLLRNALKHLSSEEAQIVILHTVAGLKHREIAKIMNMSLGTVCSKYFYCIKKLKRYIE